MSFYIDQEQKKQYLFQGILLGIFPCTLMTALTGNPLLSGAWRIATGVAVPLLLWSGIAILFKVPIAARILVGIGTVLHLFILFFELLKNPLLTLFCVLCGTGLLFLLLTSRLLPAVEPQSELQLRRLIGVSSSLLCVTMISPLFYLNLNLVSITLLLPIMTMLYLLYDYLNKRVHSIWKDRIRLIFIAAVAASILLSITKTIVFPAFCAASGCLIFASTRKNGLLSASGSLIRHPGRCLALTFLLLCAAGTLILHTHAVMEHKINVIDSAFTAVSAVCITGLSTVDIAKDLTFMGKTFLLLLIQAGGLGIMTLAAVVLHALGRLTINQEQLVSGMNAQEEPGIVSTLSQILKITFICEAVGAVLLTICFFFVHGNWTEAAGLGIFTSISAFCNAGFFPGSASLMPYAGEKCLLIIVALLIIAGGIAPAVTASLFPLRSFSRLPFISKLVILTTLLVLVGGTVLMLLFEWNGIFGGLSPCDKVVNAFFHSATLRTAGFNSVPLAQMGMPAMLIMMLFMLIGGSSGGTAGGIKITTLAVLFFAFMSTVRNKKDITCGSRRIPTSSVVQAVAVVIASMMVLLTIIIMLLTTQYAGARELIFESVSALGTVGLSLGVTPELDEVGKIIIMTAMFLGRIGPLTFFLLLSDKKSIPQSGLPPVKIPLG